jgi:uncharacterized C2H2 Zn-finger protein
VIAALGPPGKTLTQQELMVTSGHKVLISIEDEDQDALMVPIVLAYNGENHYAPTVTQSEGRVLNFYVTQAKELITHGLTWLNKGVTLFPTAVQVEADFSRGVSDISRAVEKYVNPWCSTERCKGALDGKLLPIIRTKEDQTEDKEVAFGPVYGPHLETDVLEETMPLDVLPGGEQEVELGGSPTGEQFGQKRPAEQPPVAGDVPVPKKTKLQYVCDVLNCTAVFSRLERLSDHKKVVHLGGSFPCTHCDKTFQGMSSLRRHVGQKHTKTVAIVCSEITEGIVCGQTFDERATYNSHLVKDHAHPGHNCPTCNKQFTNKQGLLRHSKYCLGDEGDPNLFECEECGKLFKRSEGLSAHKLEFHTESPKHVCGGCGKHLASHYNLKMHIQSKHGQAEGEGEGEVVEGDD